MTQGFVQKVSEKLASMADGFVVNSASHYVWGEVELPECMRTQECEEKQETE